MADYRISVYLGAGDDGARLRQTIKEFGDMPEFRNSEMEFIRHCIRYTIENDPLVKKLTA